MIINDYLSDFEDDVASMGEAESSNRMAKHKKPEVDELHNWQLLFDPTDEALRDKQATYLKPDLLASKNVLRALNQSVGSHFALSVVKSFTPDAVTLSRDEESPGKKILGYYLVYRLFWLTLSVLGLLWGVVAGLSMGGLDLLGVGTLIAGFGVWTTLMLTLTVAGRSRHTKQ